MQWNVSSTKHLSVSVGPLELLECAVDVRLELDLAPLHTPPIPTALLRGWHTAHDLLAWSCLQPSSKSCWLCWIKAPITGHSINYTEENFLFKLPFIMQPLLRPLPKSVTIQIIPLTNLAASGEMKYGG